MAPQTITRGTVAQRQVPHLVVVDRLGVPPHAVGDDVEPSAGETGLGPVGDAAAVLQGERRDRVARLRKGRVRRQDGRGAAVGLHALA